jgi:hypothetical protein
VKGSNHGNGNVTGFTEDAAVGDGVALSFVPHTGKGSRNWLARSTREIEDKARSAFESKGKDRRERERAIARREAREIARAQNLKR